MFLDIMEHRPNGRLLAYYPDTQTTKLVLDGLYFANGVAVNPDSSFVLVTETNAYRVTRYWLKGEKKGQSDVFIDNVPGFLDNIDSNGKDIFWLAVVDGPADRKLMDTLLPHPFLRKIIARLPTCITQPVSPTGYAFVLGLNLQGEIVYNLQDPSGEQYYKITSVTEHNEKLYFGTVNPTLKSIGRLPVPQKSNK